MTGSTQQGYLAMMLKGGPRIRWQPQQGEWEDKSRG